MITGSESEPAHDNLLHLAISRAASTKQVMSGG